MKFKGAKLVSFVKPMTASLLGGSGLACGILNLNYSVLNALIREGLEKEGER